MVCLLKHLHLELNRTSSRYFSPYPLTESEVDEVSGSGAAATSQHGLKIPGVSRTTIRSHGRTSDLLAGGLGRNHGLGENSILWVCDRCFKYMADGVTYELHKVRSAHVFYIRLPFTDDLPLAEMYTESSAWKNGVSAWCTCHLGDRWCQRKGMRLV
jgi:hypothetical protein